MNWNERMHTILIVGSKYKTRDNRIAEVIKKINDNNYEIIIKPNKYLVVNKFGGFGNYPNHNDLVSKI